MGAAGVFLANAGAVGSAAWPVCSDLRDRGARRTHRFRDTTPSAACKSSKVGWKSSGSGSRSHAPRPGHVDARRDPHDRGQGGVHGVAAVVVLCALQGSLGDEAVARLGAAAVASFFVYWRLRCRPAFRGGRRPQARLRDVASARSFPAPRHSSLPGGARRCLKDPDWRFRHSGAIP